MEGEDYNSLTWVYYVDYKKMVVFTGLQATTAPPATQLTPRPRGLAEEVRLRGYSSSGRQDGYSS